MDHFSDRSFQNKKEILDMFESLKCRYEKSKEMSFVSRFKEMRRILEALTEEKVLQDFKSLACDEEQTNCMPRQPPQLSGPVGDERDSVPKPAPTSSQKNQLNYSNISATRMQLFYDLCISQFTPAVTRLNVLRRSNHDRSHNCSQASHKKPPRPVTGIERNIIKADEIPNFHIPKLRMKPKSSNLLCGDLTNSTSDTDPRFCKDLTHERFVGLMRQYIVENTSKSGRIKEAEIEAFLLSTTKKRCGKGQNSTSARANLVERQNSEPTYAKQELAESNSIDRRMPKSIAVVIDGAAVDDVANIHRHDGQHSSQQTQRTTKPPKQTVGNEVPVVSIYNLMMELRSEFIRVKSKNMIARYKKMSAMLDKAMNNDNVLGREA